MTQQKTASTEIIQEFLAATNMLLQWYDGDRSIITEGEYTCPTPDGAFAMTKIRTAAYKAQRAGYGPSDTEYIKVSLFDV